MFLFLKKKSEESEKPAMPAGNEPTALEEFVPYYCHFDSHTLLTKNGELMQVIKISSNARGLNYESGDGTHNTVRDNIRRAICDTVESDKYSLWIHALRKRKPINFSAHFDEPF